MSTLEDVQVRLAELGRKHTPADVAAVMRELDMVVTDRSLLDVLDQLRRNSTGAGLLEELLALDGVTDVLVNGTAGVYIDRGHGLELSSVQFASDEDVRRLAIRLAASAGRRLDDAQPFVDGRLADGTRLHAVLAPVSEPGTLISLRVPSRIAPSLSELAERGSITPLGLELLESIVEQKVPFLISGGTGTGKTTLLAAMLSHADPSERIVVVEDARELNPRHPHCVRLEGRPANMEGAGGITLTTLVRQALRMRPDRVVLGEVRGAELIDLLNALNTGHEGGCGTVHANALSDVPARLEALAALGGQGREACHAQVAAALRVIIHITRRPDGMRMVEQIGTIVRDGELRTHVGIAFNQGQQECGPGWEQLAAAVGRPRWAP